MSFIDENYDEAADMDMPCLCERCRTWFDLNDGVGSDKWYPGTVICEECGEEEQEEIQRDEEIEELKIEISDAEQTISDSKATIEMATKRLKELGYDITTSSSVPDGQPVHGVHQGQVQGDSQIHEGNDRTGDGDIDATERPGRGGTPFTITLSN